MKEYLIKTLLAFSLITGVSCYSAHAAAGDLYDGGLNALAIYKFDSAGNRTIFKSGFNADWLAFDSKGNLFVADPSDSKIVKITPAGGQTDFAIGIIPAGIAFDGAGNLFAINRASTGSILKYTPSGAMTTFVANLGDGGPTGLAFDSNGNLYVSKGGNNMAGNGSIVRFAPNGTMSPFAAGLFLPAGMAVDSANNVYVADLGSGSIFRFTPGGIKTTFASGLNSPRALAFDFNGILYVGEFGTHDIVKFPGGVKTAFSHDDTFIGGIAFEPPTAQLLNISTRASVQTSDRVTIAGFIITGTDPKQVVLRGLGPSLPQAQISLPLLQDPTLTLNTSPPVFNNDWQTAANSNQIPLALQPKDARESAILTTLQPGLYTVTLAGNNMTTGIGLVEVYDITSNVFSELANISTRAFVGTGDAITIGGFISGGGNGSSRVVIRGLGPSLPVSGPLPNPMLTLFNANGQQIATNDNWKVNDQTHQSQVGAIIATGLAPTNDLESAILVTLPAGGYTALLQGVGNATGIGLIEVYNLK